MLFHIRYRQISIFWWAYLRCRCLDCLWNRNTTRRSRRWWWGFLLLPSIRRHFRRWRGWFCWHCRRRRESWVRHHYLLLWRHCAFVWKRKKWKRKFTKRNVDWWWTRPFVFSRFVFLFTSSLSNRWDIYKPFLLFVAVLLRRRSRWQNLLVGMSEQNIFFRVCPLLAMLGMSRNVTCLFLAVFSFEILDACRRADAPDFAATRLDSASRPRSFRERTSIAELGIIQTMESLSHGLY